MSEVTSNTIQIKAYTSDGFEVVFTLPNAAVADAAAKLAQVRAAGYLAYQPEPVESERQPIMSVMHHLGESGSPVIAAYPAWKYEGKYGEYKFASIYLDSPEDIAQFEAQSGLKLDDIPLCDGEAGVRRKYNAKRHPKEILVKRAFDMIKIADGAYDDGKPRYRYDYAARLPLTQPTAWTEEQVKKFVAKWEADGLAQADLTKALKVNRWSEWKGTAAEADAAVETYVKANRQTADASH